MKKEQAKNARALIILLIIVSVQLLNFINSYFLTTDQIILKFFITPNNPIT